MDSDPQILLHEIGPPFNSSGGAKIHRCCTDHFIRARFSDKLIKWSRLDTVEAISKRLVRMRPPVAFASSLCYAIINETDRQARASLRSSSPGLWRIAVLFVLAIYCGAAIR
jgi:hypothetical protein